MIRAKKEKFKEIKSKRSQEDSIKRAKELQQLREERIRVEGKAELNKSRNEEIRRIGAARAANPGRLRQMATGLIGFAGQIKQQKKEGHSGFFDIGGGGQSKSPMLNMGSGGSKNIFLGIGTQEKRKQKRKVKSQRREIVVRY